MGAPNSLHNRTGSHVRPYDSIFQKGNQGFSKKKKNQKQKQKQKPKTKQKNKNKKKKQNQKPHQRGSQSATA